MTPSKCLTCILPDCDDNCSIIRNENYRYKYLSKPDKKKIQREAQKKWVSQNKEHLREYERKYRPKYRKKNRERINRQQREKYYLKNTEKVSEYKKEWYRREKYEPKIIHNQR